MKLAIHLKTIRGFVKSWFRLPLTLRVTGAGWKFLALTLIVGFAGVNTGNNLLYLIFGLMLSFITASGILSDLMLRRLQVQRVFPKHIFAGQAAPVSLTVLNGKRFIASFSLVVEDMSQKHAPEQSRYILKVLPRSQVHVVYPVTFAVRGSHRPGNIRISTRYPFSFFKKSVSFAEHAGEVLVYPALQPLAQRELSGLITQFGDFIGSRQKGIGQEIHNIREYAQGDNNARIHWKSTAKLATLMVKEFEHEHRQKVSLFLDTALPADSSSGAKMYQNVESAVSLTASYAVYFIKKNFQVQLVTVAHKSLFGSGQRHLFSLLRVLALIQAQNGDSRTRFQSSLRQAGRDGALKILISSNASEKYPLEMFAKIVRTGRE